MKVCIEGAISNDGIFHSTSTATCDGYFLTRHKGDWVIRSDNYYPLCHICATYAQCDTNGQKEWCEKKEKKGGSVKGKQMNEGCGIGGGQIQRDIYYHLV